MVDSFDFTIDDFDWSGTGSSPQPSPVEPAEELAPAAPEPAPAPVRRRVSDQIPEELLSPAFIERGKKGDQFKRRNRPAVAMPSIDEFDWGSSGIEAAPAASDDWALTRGIKESYSHGTDAISTAGEMARIATLPIEEQRAAMLELGKRPKAPSTLQEPDVRGIGGIGEGLTWLGESAGQMIGSVGAAIFTGGAAGAATGAGVGGAGGALAGGVGALPGAVAGAVTGAGWGTLGAFGVMGIGGMASDLLSDEAIQAGLADGTISPNEIFAWTTAAGSAIGALDAIPATKLLKRVTGDIGPEAVKKTLKEYAKAGIKGGLKSAGEEGVTEAGQGAISEFGQAIVGGDADTAERLWSVINQGLAGAVGGFGPGAGGGVITHARAPGIANPAAPAGAAAPPVPPGGSPPVQPQGPGGLGQNPAAAAGSSGAGTPVTQTRVYPKPEEPAVGAAAVVKVVRDGEVSPDIAAAQGIPTEETVFDTEDEGEFTGAAPGQVLRPGQPAQSSAGAGATSPRVGDQDLTAALRAGQPAAANENMQSSAGLGTPSRPPEELPATPSSKPPAHEDVAGSAPAPAPVDEAFLQQREEEARLAEQMERAQAAEQDAGFIPEQPTVPVKVVKEPKLDLAVKPQTEVTPRQNVATPSSQEVTSPEDEVFLANYASELSRIIDEDAAALAELEATPEPEAFEEEQLPTSYKRKPKAPTPRVLRQRQKGREEYEAKLTKHRAAKEKYAAKAPLARTALSEALAKITTMTAAQRKAFTAKLSPEALGQLKRAAQAEIEKAAPAPQKRPPVRAKPVGRRKEPPKPKRVPRGAAVVLRSKRDGADAKMAAHFDKSLKPVRLKPLGFSDAEIDVMERGGLAEKGSMTADEFRRWRSTVKGAPVPEGIGPKPTPPKTENVQKVERFPVLRTPEEVGYQRWLERKKAEAEAPYERKVPVGTKGAAERQIAETEKGVPVTAKSAKAEPKAETIPTKPGFKGERFKRGKEKPGERVEQLEQELQQRLPRELKAAGVLSELSQTQMEQAAKKGAKALAKEIYDRMLPPLVAAREHVDEALKVAIAAYKKGDEAAVRRFLEKQEALDEASRTLSKAEEAEKKRRTSPATGKKKSEAMATESERVTRNLAFAERDKPKDEQNQLLIDIADLWDLILPIQKKKDADSNQRREGWKARIKKLQDQRVAQQKVFEEAEAAADILYEARKREEEASLQEDMQELLATGLASQSEIEEYQFDREAKAQFKERNKRAIQSTPIIHATLAANPRPMPTGTSAAAERTLVKDIKTWAEKWVKDTKAALKKAGIKVNERISTRFNTPEENALIYVEDLLDKFDWMETQAARKGKSLSPRQELHRGQGLFEAHTAVGLIEPLPEGLTSAERRLQRYKDEQLLAGMMTDASQTKAAREDPWGIKAVKQIEQMNEQARFLRPVTNLDQIAIQRQEEGPLADALRRALRAKGFGAPKEDLTALPLGRDFESTTGAAAIDKYMRGWKKRGGMSGWQNLMRRALMRSLKKMVGDTPVHFVDGSVIASFEGTTGRPGMFVHQANGKSFVLLDSKLKHRPALLDETLLHELTHAATAHAIDNNIRGTRDIIRQMMTSLQATLADIEQLPEKSRYAFTNEHEFLTMALNNAGVQEMMASLQAPVKARAAIRALGKGRAMPNYWDLMVAAVEHAIGLFTTGRAGTSYMDSILRIYPHVALSSSEQMRDAEIRLKGKDIKDLQLGSPFDLAQTMRATRQALNNRATDWTGVAHRRLNKFMTPTETIRRRVADVIYGGRMTNPMSDLINELETQQRRIEEGMRPGDQMDDDLRRWMMADPGNRREILAEAHDLVVNASIDNIDMRKTLEENHWIRNDAFHKTKRKRTKATFRHARDTAKRTLYDKYKARWDALPDELKPMLSQRLDHMKQQMLDYETKMVRHFLDRLLDSPSGKWNLPPGMSRTDAVAEIMDDNMSDELKTALGENAKTIGDMGKFGARDQMYAPASRMGRHFISGRRNIATPTTKHGDVLFDQDALDRNGIFRFVFNDLRDAVDYTNEMATTGKERVLKLQRKYVNPKTGEFVPHDWHELDAKGQMMEAQPVYYVTMQDRFMAMSDSPAELAQMREDLLATGEFEHISTSALLKEHRSLTSSMPLQLQTMINNINSQSAVEERDKALAIEMITNHFIRTQQGNRITKRMIRRTGVSGFETGADEMFHSFHNNNEMMTRHTVALDRIPAIAEANRKINLMSDAMRTRQPADLIKLSMEDRALINRGYGNKDPDIVDRFNEDQREINARIDAAMSPSIVPFEQALNTVSSIATLNYLAKPAYFAIQAMGLFLQTFPNMAAEFSRRDGYAGITRSMRYLQKGMADVGVTKQVLGGVVEAGKELADLARGFKPRKDWKNEARPMRRAKDFVVDLKADLVANNAKYASTKARALQTAYDRNHLGQAGLDQPNLRMNLQQKGLRNKFMRSVERSTRVFRALQEGLETVNRAAPICAYVEYYMDKGLSEDQAIELAINNMVKEQTGYSKANWPAWLGNPVAGTIFMFKKFAAQQAFAVYDSLKKAIDPTDKASQRAAMVHLGTMTVMLALVGGLAGNPFWEPIRYTMYLLGLLGFPVPETWDEAKTKGEQGLAALTGETIAETAMYGLPRLLGFDLSNRVALDSLLFYQQPEEQTQDEWLKIVGQTAIGAVGSMVFDAAGNISGLTDSDASWPKWLSQMPAPGFVKDILKSADLVAHGPTTTTGVSVGDPIGILGGLVTAAGIKTRSAARPFEQGSAAQYKESQRVADDKSELIRRVNASGGMTSANMRAINEWNKAHPEKEDRITAKSLINARKRKTKTEREIREQNLEAQ